MSVPGLVLPKDTLPSSEGHTFPGFPGVWFPEQPIAISTLGFDTAKDAEARVKELGLPLKRAQADPPPAPDPEPEPEPAAEAAEGSDG